MSSAKIDRVQLLLPLLLPLLVGGPLLVLGQKPAANASSTHDQLQTHLAALQTQAQRQLSALAAHTGNSQVLEVLANVGKAIQQQVAAEPSLKKTAEPAAKYREQGEQLRQEIVRRAGQLQQVVVSSRDQLKASGDLIVRRLLDQLNGRLDQAKSKADKIAAEPASNEMAIAALNTINQGLNNVNNIVTNIVNRLDLAVAQQQSQTAAGLQQQQPAGSASLPRAGLLLDPNRLRMNLHQLGQQFSSAIAAAQQQRPASGQQAQVQQQPHLPTASPT